MAAPAHIDKANFDTDTPALDWQPVLEIHRGDPDGFVGYGAQRPDGSVYHVGAVKVRDVREMLPGLLSQFIAYDGYFTVNSYRMAGNIWRKTGLPYLLRKEKLLLNLAANYAEMDPYKMNPPIAWQDAQIEALRRQRDGVIPPFSMMASSGRGVYLFWLLRDENDPDKLPHAWPSTILRYKAVNNALFERLKDLGCDERAKDAVRFLRHPGSIHTKVMKRVTYSLTVQADDGGRLTYSLPELEQFLQIDAPAPSLPADVRKKARPQLYTRTGKGFQKAKRKGSRPQNRKAYHRTNELRAQDLETIEAWRGGWLHAGDVYPDGFTSPGRGLMLKLYAGWLRGSDKDGDAVLDAVRVMAANCKPPYPSDPNDMKLKRIVTDTFSTDPKKHVKNVPNVKLVGWLGLSEKTDPDLLDKLHSILPPPVKALRDAAIPKQSDYTAERRRIIAHIIELRGGKIPSYRKMPALLAADPFNVVNPTTGKPWSHEIIRQDYDWHGYPAARPGRRRKADPTGGGVEIPLWFKSRK